MATTKPASPRKFGRALCAIGLHKSDRDYGQRWATGEVLSHCERCDKTISHPLLRWF